MSKKVLEIGGLEIPSRLSIGDVRNAKAHHGIDLSETDEGAPAIRMMLDGIVLVEVIFALYERQLKAKGINTREQLEDKISTDDDIEGLKKAVVDAVSGFFPLPRMVYTKMQESLHSDLTSLIQDQGNQANPSGTV